MPTTRVSPAHIHNNKALWAALAHILAVRYCIVPKCQYLRGHEMVAVLKTTLNMDNFEWICLWLNNQTMTSVSESENNQYQELLFTI